MAGPPRLYCLGDVLFSMIFVSDVLLLSLANDQPRPQRKVHWPEDDSASEDACSHRVGVVMR